MLPIPIFLLLAFITSYHLQAMNSSRFFSQRAFNYAKQLATPKNIVHYGLFLGPFAVNLFDQYKLYNTVHERLDKLSNTDDFIVANVHMILGTQGVINPTGVKVKMGTFSKKSNACLGVQIAQDRYIILNRKKNQDDIEPHLFEKAFFELAQKLNAAKEPEVENILREFYQTNTEFAQAAYFICHEAQRLNNLENNKDLWKFATAPLTTQAVISGLYYIVQRQPIIATLLQTSLLRGIVMGICKKYLAQAGLARYEQLQELQRDAAITAPTPVLLGGLEALNEILAEQAVGIVAAFDKLQEDLDTQLPDSKTLHYLVKVSATALLNFYELNVFTPHARIEDRIEPLLKRTLTQIKSEDRP